jgi:hypothetical protein
VLHLGINLLPVEFLLLVLFINDLYGMHPVVYSSLKGYDFETVYTTISSENKQDISC